MILLLIVVSVSAVLGQITPVPREITPVPRRNQREKDGDGQVTFTEFLLSDKPYIKHASKNFHKFDDNGDSAISKEEFDTYYTKLDEERRHEEKNRELFFNNHFNRQPFSSPFFDYPIFNRQGPSAATNETVSAGGEGSFLFFS